MTTSDEARREFTESKGHDFTDWRAQPIDYCNFCGIKLDDPKAEQPCDISDRFKDGDVVLWSKRMRRRM